jgi:hypothetical protein
VRQPGRKDFQAEDPRALLGRSVPPNPESQSIVGQHGLPAGLRDPVVYRPAPACFLPLHRDVADRIRSVGGRAGLQAAAAAVMPKE